MPSYTEWLIQDLRLLPQDRKALLKTDNPFEYEFLKRSIADRERLLDQLTAEERQIIERIVINGERGTAVSKETGMKVRLIYIIKDKTIEKLLTLRHGAGYRP